MISNIHAMFNDYATNICNLTILRYSTLFFWRRMQCACKKITQCGSDLIRSWPRPEHLQRLSSCCQLVGWTRYRESEAKLVFARRKVGTLCQLKQVHFDLVIMWVCLDNNYVVIISMYNISGHFWKRNFYQEISPHSFEKPTLLNQIKKNTKYNPNI